MAGIADIDGIAFEDICKGLRGDGDRAAHELRDVVALHREAMDIGTGHGEFEWTGSIALFIDMGDEWTGE